MHLLKYFLRNDKQSLLSLNIHLGKLGAWQKKKLENKFCSSLDSSVSNVAFVRGISAIFDNLIAYGEQTPLVLFSWPREWNEALLICCILGRYGVHAFLLLGSPLYLRTAASDNIVPSPRQPNHEWLSSQTETQGPAFPWKQVWMLNTSFNCTINLS